MAIKKLNPSLKLKRRNLSHLRRQRRTRIALARSQMIRPLQTKTKSNHLWVSRRGKIQASYRIMTTSKRLKKGCKNLEINRNLSKNKTSTLSLASSQWQSHSILQVTFLKISKANWTTGTETSSKGIRTLASISLNWTRANLKVFGRVSKTRLAVNWRQVTIWDSLNHPCSRTSWIKSTRFRRNISEHKKESQRRFCWVTAYKLI